ncbi:hypothetical protein C8A00DRAFT_29145 [Chaetomidium leptoderma]|uniref:BZIP domain-containing protein n=1 Tax=Chaetomidium leptoderma TaxID=669021 RepID=A0AAN6VVA6_9PEZI|nr:hypothetical protein C8A00DRAFT_29145 [Chaetomidium leptoderma]
MSQGGSAPRSTSSHSSRSPATATDSTSSPPLQRSRAAQDDHPRPQQPLRHAGGFAPALGDGAGQQPGNWAAGRRDILNPAGPPHGNVSGYSPAFSQPPPARGSPQPVMGAGQHGTHGSPSRPFAYQATTPRTANQTIPPTTSSPASRPTSADRGSPHAAHPYPMAAAARRILTPKSPRAAGLSRAAMRTLEAQHHHHGASLPPISRGIISVYDAHTHGNGPSPLGAPPQFHSSSAPGWGPVAPSPTRSASGLAQSLSQHSLAHEFPSAPPPQPSPQSGSRKREHDGRPALPMSGPPFAAPIPASHPYGGTMGMFGDPRWGPGPLSSMSSGAAMNFPMTEGQPVLAITPQHGEEILVPVDVHQGSKHSDQKRQRNAGASARFRQRKKEREKEQQEELAKLESEKRELEDQVDELAKRCQDLQVQRDFYHGRRDYLLNIVSQLPGGKPWADQEPPSPTLRTIGASFAPPPDSGSAAMAPRQPPPPPPPHAHIQQPQHYPAPFHQSLAHPQPQPHPRSSSYGDPSTLEPPARRRRTDSEPQLSTTSYSLMTTASLPPITGPPTQSFGIPPSPHVTPPPPPGTARLPPLRFDQARTPSITPPLLRAGVPPPPQTMPPQSAASPYVTSRPLPYETGWAADPRPHTEGGGPR